MSTPKSLESHTSATHRFTDTATHQVTNQPSPLENINLYSQDKILKDMVELGKAQWAEQDLHNFGALTGSKNVIEWGFQANDNKPELRTHNRNGLRVDEVTFHPAYHQLMTQAISNGLHASPWLTPQPGAHVHRAAKTFMQTQIEAGHGCPITMTFACLPTLLKQKNIADIWVPLVTSLTYSPENKPYYEKEGVTIGMGMTEKQGGSDVRANTTTAQPLNAAGAGQIYEITGHKWFLSAPMCDAFLVLAQTDMGLSCFLIPRWRPDGTKNPILIQQLKNKMGNVSNASSEVEFRSAMGWLIGDEGRGIANILEMVALTRFDCMIGSSAGMRQATVQAIHHCSQRKAFGDYLINQPLMQDVLADLALESEAATQLSFRMAMALDRMSTCQEESTLLRLVTAIGKYWICKRTPAHAYEAMECIGGPGVMEDCIMPRLYREAPINAIWEGSGNVQCLDVMRAINKEPNALNVLKKQLTNALGFNQSYDQYVRNLIDTLETPNQEGIIDRFIVEQLAKAIQASVLIENAKSLCQHQTQSSQEQALSVARLYCEARLKEHSGDMFGAFNPVARSMRKEIQQTIERSSIL